MEKKLNCRGKKFELPFYISYIVMFVFVHVALFMGVPMPMYVKVIFWSVALVFYLLSLLKNNYTKKEIILFAILTAFMLTVCITMSSYYMMIGYLCIAGAKNIDIKQLLRIDFFTRIILFSATLILCALGVVENGIVRRVSDPTIRYTLGFDHPNTTFLFILSFIAVYVYLTYDRIGIYDYLAIGVFAGVFYYVTDSKTGIISVALLIILVVLAKKINIFRYKAVKILTPFAFPVLGIFSYVLSELYSKESRIMVILNKLFTGRLGLSKKYLDYFGIDLFGHNIYSAPDNWIFDNLYTYLLVGAGLIFSVLITVWYYKLAKKMLDNNRDKETVMLLLFAIYGVTERAVVILFLNFSLVFFASLLYKNTMFEEKEKKSYFLDDAFSFIFRCINYAVPKDSKLICFESNPDFSDNAKAMYDYIKNRGEYRTVWLTKDNEKALYLSEKGIAAYKKTSLPGIKTVLRSKYLVSSHMNFYKRKSKNQIWLELWHGTPLKNLGYLDINNISYRKKDIKNFAKRVDYMAASSELAADALSRCFGISIDKFIISGQPRNDEMLNSMKTAEKTFNEITSDKYNISGCKNLIYMPTFRMGYKGISEGEKIESSLFRLKDYNKSELENFLLKNNINIFLKLHPFEESFYSDKKIIKSILPKNTYILSTDLLHSNGYTIYDIIGFFDALITDYSSIYFDYMLVDKPIIFNIGDVSEYGQKRGFVFDNIEQYMPGYIVKTGDEFIKAVENSLSFDEFKEKRRKLNEKLNVTSLPVACETIYKRIF